MHDAAFATAAWPAPTRILGLRLRAYSLGHELLLTRLRNPLAQEKAEVRGQRSEISGLSSFASSLAIEYRHLLQAVLVCHHSFEGYERFTQDWLAGLKVRVWTWRMRRTGLARGPGLDLAGIEFLNYRRAGSTWAPGDPPEGQRGRPPGSPFLLRLHSFLMSELRLSELEAWNYPLGLAQWRWCAFWESQGAFEVWNEDEVEFQNYAASKRPEDEKIRAELRERMRLLIGEKALQGKVQSPESRVQSPAITNADGESQRRDNLTFDKDWEVGGA